MLEIGEAIQCTNKISMKRLNGNWGLAQLTFAARKGQGIQMVLRFGESFLYILSNLCVSLQDEWARYVGSIGETGDYNTGYSPFAVAV